MRPWILGLTGGIGSGKSAAAEYFAALGVHTLDADQVARWVVEPGRPALLKIVQHFGAEILRPDGQLDRPQLRERIFQAENERRWLEQLLHPLIGEAIVADLAQVKSPYAILVSPLLVESGQLEFTQRILVVDSPEALQLQRTMQRDGVSEEQVRAILRAQAQREERLKYADDVLINDGDLAQLQHRVERLHQFYLGLPRGQS